MQIPYSLEARPDTGLNNGKIGMWLFLASEVMLFGAFFATYIVLRVGSPDWPAGKDFGLNVWVALVNTIVLIVSSWTMVMAWASLVRKDFGKFQKYMAMTVALGGVFMVIKGFEYYGKFSHGFTPDSHIFLAIYFTMTGLHGIHVLSGMLVNSYFCWPGSKMWKTEPERFIGRIELAGLFWHLVDLVWIFLFPVLYLL